MFISALFTIAKLWRQLKCPTTDDGIKKMWYIYMHDIVLFRHKKNESMEFSGKWMERQINTSK
jgi:hypothetical protein